MTLLERQLKAEKELTAMCELVNPGQGHEHAQRIIARHEEHARQEMEILLLMAPEVKRVLDAPSAEA